MKIHKAISEGRAGKARPVYLLVGPETLLIERAVHALRRAVVGDGGISGFNEDVLVGNGLDGAKLVSIASTLPMMADRRFVLVRHIDQMKTSEQAEVAAYVANPSESTCLVMTAAKIAGNTKLGKAVSKTKARFDAAALKGAALRDFGMAEASDRGHVLAPSAASLLLDALGDDLAAWDDAIERLSLFVGPGQRINDAAVEQCVMRVRAESIFALVDAVSLKDHRKAVASTASLLRDREPALRILALVARQIRIVAKMREALASGMGSREAATKAGAPPFKANALTEAARRFKMRDLERAFDIIAQTDLALKGGSKQPDDIVLHQAIAALCR